MNLDVKSNLAKLLATENITIQHDNVKTASFDVKNRVLTLPIFKQQSGDVTDMLIAHECAHALWTPYKEWEGITDPELRSYVNVLEDCRIDLLIQAKYPGTVKNYLNGFDILEKKDFFGLFGKDINKDLMIIDKINLRSKSLQRLPFGWSEQDKKWLAKVDTMKTFDDVLALAKEILDWQKQQVEEMRKLPDFDNHVIAKNYELSDDEEESDTESQEDGNSDGNSEEQNDFFKEEADDEKNSNQSGASEKSDEKKEEAKDEGVPQQYGSGNGGDATERKLLKAVTDDSYTQKSEQLLDNKSRGFAYGNLPEPNLKDITSYKEFLKTFATHKQKQNYGNYDVWLRDTFKKFKKDNKKTVNYLVKEFEMKKSAQAYKRASQDKTGIIDPLKLPSYKYSDDIFKRLTIIPDGKNHGMMMLLDWSGSMSDTLMHTVEQLLNLVEFVRKVNIPFEVYFFTSERKYWSSNESAETKSFNHKDGDWRFEDFNLVNCFSHRMTKKEFELAGMYMYHMAFYYNASYVYHKHMDSDMWMARNESYGIPSEFYLGNTPLNEALIFCNKLIPMFKEKYGIEKMSFITLTDGGANSFRHTIVHKNDQYGAKQDYDKTAIIQSGKKKMVLEGYGDLTNKLLRFLRTSYDLNNIGFYILKRVRKWDIEKHMPGKDYMQREQQYLKARKQFTKDKALAVNKEGYNKYFLLDGKKLKVENFDLSEATVKKGTASELKRIFAGSMKNRLVSRVILSKFIEEVA
jgi:hypothetical protein